MSRNQNKVSSCSSSLQKSKYTKYIWELTKNTNSNKNKTIAPNKQFDIFQCDKRYVSSKYIDYSECNKQMKKKRDLNKSCSIDINCTINNKNISNHLLENKANQTNYLIQHCKYVSQSLSQTTHKPRSSKYNHNNTSDWSTHDKTSKENWDFLYKIKEQKEQIEILNKLVDNYKEKYEYYNNENVKWKKEGTKWKDENWNLKTIWSLVEQSGIDIEELMWKYNKKGESTWSMNSTITLNDEETILFTPKNLERNQECKSIYVNTRCGSTSVPKLNLKNINGYSTCVKEIKQIEKKNNKKRNWSDKSQIIQNIKKNYFYQ